MADEILEGTAVPPGPEILKLSTDQEMPEEKRMDLFSIDGVTYSMLLNPPPGVGLRYLDLCRTSSVEAAVAYLMEATLGTEGYQALLGYEQLTDEQYNWILTQVTKRTLGNKDRPKGKSGIKGLSS